MKRIIPLLVVIFNGLLLNAQFSTPGNGETFVLEAQHNDLENDVQGIIDQDEQSVLLILPAGADLTALIPTIAVSDQAVVDPPSGEAVDLTSPVAFTVTAFHGEDRIYTVSAEAESDILLPGDANCDGQVDVLDVIAMIHYYLELDPEPFCFDNADLNVDGIINILDVILCVDIIADR